MKIGIVGLPNAGKSTLFNALTAAGAETGDYPFTTIDPNVAVVAVPDPRLEAIAELLSSTPITYDTIEFHDIAGLVPGAAEGEGLGNRFLAAIRETDAILHLVRAHDTDGVPHPEGRVDPGEDLDLIETELLAADLEQAEGRLARLVKQARGGDKEAVAEHAWVAAVVEALQSGRPVRSVPVPQAAEAGPRNLSALTSKPMLYVANVTEGSGELPEAVAERAAQTGANAVCVSARVESELRELDADDAAEMREGLGVHESGLETVVRGAFELLGLVTFFTAGEAKEAKAYSVPKGATAYDAAGKIHTEIQEGMVKAEVVGWQDLVDLGGYSGARDKGKLRIESRDYVVRDGEVLTIKH